MYEDIEDIEDVEERFAKAQKNYNEVNEQLKLNGLSKQEIDELKTKRKALAREMNVLAKMHAVGTRIIRREGGDTRNLGSYGRRRASTSKIVGYLAFQFMLLIFQIVTFNFTIGIFAIFSSIVFFITAILAISLTHKTNRPMWTENKEKIEKPLFRIIILLTILNLLLGVIILVFS